MKTLIVYDSMYGNTEKLAVAMAKETKGKSVRVGEINAEDMTGVSLLIVGSPTQGGRPTEAITKFLYSLPENDVKNITAGAFDTRMGINEHGMFLKLLMKTIGYAGEKMAAGLKNKGVKTMAGTEGFIVEGKEGPLKKGELERAVKWVREIK